MRRSILLFFVLFLPFVNKGQEIPPVNTYLKDVYGAQNQNWSISQSTNGFLYFGNSEGLLEFDGSNWKKYILPNHQIVRSVYCDGKGNIYTGSYAEFGFWNYGKDRQLHYHSLNPFIPEKSLSRFKSEEIWHIIPIGRGIIFQSFAILFLYQDGKLTEILPPGNMMFLREVYHRNFIQILGKGIYELEKEKFVFLRGSKIFNHVTVSTILPYSSHSFLIGTAEKGLFIQSGNTFHSFEGPINNVLKKEQLNKAILLDQNKIAFGTLLNGVYICDYEGKIIYHFNRKNGLPNNTILALSKDLEGNIWVGMDNGISHIQIESPLNFYFSKEGILSSVYAAALFQKKLFIGTNSGVFYKTILPASSQNGGDFRLLKGTQGQAWELIRDQDRLLLGHNAGTFLIDPKLHLQKISNVTGGWKFKYLTEDSTLAYQATYTGLIRFKKMGNWTFQKRIIGFGGPILKISLINEREILCEDPYQNIYYFRLNAALDSVVRIKRLGTKEGLPELGNQDLEEINHVNYIRKGNDYFRIQIQSTKIFLKKDVSLSLGCNENPFKLYQGIGKDYFRIYSNKIVLYSFSSVTQSYRYTFTLPLKLTGNNPIIPISKETYLFCLDDGYGIYHPKWEPKKKIFSFPPVFRSIEVLSRNPHSHSINSSQPLHVSTSEKVPIELEPDDNDIKIVFGSVQYFQNPLFRYRVSGLNENWSSWDPLTSKEFINLNSGKFEFDIQSDLDSTIYGIQIHKKAHWYRSEWALFIYGLLGFFFLLGLIRWRDTIKLNRQKRVYDKRMAHLKNQKLLLEQKIILVQNEKLKEDITSKNQELSNTAYSLIRKNEVLKEIKEEIKETQLEMGSDLPQNHFKRIMRYIDSSFSSEKDWILFEKNFNEVHYEFFTALKTLHPEITPSELKLSACLRMNLSSKEISPILHISIRGVEIKRYRLRKKLGIREDVNLSTYLMGIFSK